MNKIKLNSISLNGNSLNLVGAGKTTIVTNLITATFNVIANQSTSILSTNFDISQIEKIKVDGVEIPISTSHIFSKSGNAKVEFFMREDSTSCDRMFNSITAINYCDLSYLPTNITTMERMFSNSSIQNIEIRKLLKLPNLSTMYAMFLSCKNLDEIDLSNISTDKCNIGYIFERCKNLQKATNIRGKFITIVGTYLDCESLKDVNDEFMHINPFISSGEYNFRNNHSLTNWNPFYGWGKSYLQILSANLTAVSIHLLIERSASVADGALRRILTLHETAKSNWMASEYYDADVVMANEKLITIA